MINQKNMKQEPGTPNTKNGMNLRLQSVRTGALSAFSAISVARQFLVLFGLIWCCLVLFGPKIFSAFGTLEAGSPVR
jgi:hypothetical protein